MDKQEIKELLDQMSTRVLVAGDHIAVTEEWIQNKLQNGETVMLVGTDVFLLQIESLAVKIAQATIKEVEQYLLGM